MQLSVEEYFTSSGMLPVATYWIGISRATRSAQFAFADNTTIPSLPSDVPYLHWNWLTPNRRVQDMNCVEARWGAGRGCTPCHCLQHALCMHST